MASKIKIIFSITFVMSILVNFGFGQSEEILCGKQGAFCGIGLNVRGCCKGFYCNIAPNDAYAYCDSLANPTCGKEGDICGPGQGTKGKKCCPNYKFYSVGADSHSFCHLIRT